MKALELLNNIINSKIDFGYSNLAIEAKSELEEIQKEDEYIHQKMKKALPMGNKAQNLVFVEVYQIIKNRTTK